MESKIVNLVESFSKWRTPAVVGLCQAMREAQDFSAMPILADALQEVGFDDENALSRLRGKLTFLEAERVVALLFSRESARSVLWMEDFVLVLRGRTQEDDVEGINLTIDYDLVVERARRFSERKGRCNFGTFYLPFPTPDEFRSGSPTIKEFWRNFELITGRAVGGKEMSFFYCSC